ncbi:hypothetical protein [Amycolatopsis sp. WAC 04169]|uniref:hypothetical protein n=1 Tax=Amycolatopsis sp. WAC 04169 TaxID=2203197 RepID=UPI001F3051FF|nr:hypothetical protein [Amycolatopsis sp. WAC 04169]
MGEVQAPLPWKHQTPYGAPGGCEVARKQRGGCHQVATLFAFVDEHVAGHPLIVQVRADKKIIGRG